MRCLSDLFFCYLDNKARPSELCIPSQSKRHTIQSFLGQSVYKGRCCYWKGKSGSCDQGANCPCADTHVPGRATVFARLLNRLPLDERPEVQVRLPGSFLLL